MYLLGRFVHVENYQLYLKGRQDFILKIGHVNCVDVSIGLHWFALLRRNFVTCFRLLISCEGDRECRAIFIVLELLIVCEIEVFALLLKDSEHTVL